MNFEEEKSVIKIKSQIANKWLYQLGFEYKDIKKDMFINRDKQSNMVKDCKNFLKKIKKLNLYLIESNKNSVIKDKTYLFNYVADGDNCQIIIGITYD